MNLTGLLASLIWLATNVDADLKINSPASGNTVSVSGGTASVDVTWGDDGLTPNSKSATSITVILCTGANNNIQAVSTLASGVSAASSSYKASIPAGVGASGAYFIQLYATYPSGYTIHYTNRFALNGMTGSVKPSGKATDPPPPNSGNNNAAGNVLGGGGGNTLTLPADISLSFTVPYPMQTGQIKFAPMQMQPGSTVTATTWTRKYPTSAVTYYSAPVKSPNCLSTVTPGWSYVRESLQNDASPAPNPTLSGSWYAASKKIVRPTLKRPGRFE